MVHDQVQRRQSEDLCCLRGRIRGSHGDDQSRQARGGGSLQADVGDEGERRRALEDDAGPAGRIYPDAEKHHEDGGVHGQGWHHQGPAGDVEGLVLSQRLQLSGTLVDLGIGGRKALVCAASKGLGRGCAEALAREGVEVTILARTESTVRKTAEEIGAMAGHPVQWLACDITTAEGRAAALLKCPQPDILFNNAGGPPPGDFRDWDRDAWIRAIDANMLTPIELIKATIDGMIAREFGRIVNITSSAVKAPIDILGLSNGARSGLTGFVAACAFLCSAQAGYIVGQNLLIDGGAFPGTF